LATSAPRASSWSASCIGRAGQWPPSAVSNSAKALQQMLISRAFSHPEVP